MLRDSKETPNKIAEFLTVLVFALCIGAAAMLSILYLSGLPQIVVLTLLVIVTVASWSFLRKRFHRI